MPVCLGEFVETAKPISATTPLSRVVELFQNDPGANYYILVRDKRPAGLISRTIAFEFAVSAGADHQAVIRFPHCSDTINPAIARYGRYTART